MEKQPGVAWAKVSLSKFENLAMQPCGSK